MAKKKKKSQTPDAVQKVGDRPIVVDVATILITQTGKRIKDGVVEAFGKLLTEWPASIYVINREFRLKKVTAGEGNTETAIYAPVKDKSTSCPEKAKEKKADLQSV